MTSFGNRVTADVMHLDEVILESGEALNQEGYFQKERILRGRATRRRNVTNSDRGRSRRGEGRATMKADLGVMPRQAEEHQRWWATHQKPADRHGTDPLRASEATPTTHTLYLDLGPPDGETMYFCSSCPGLWYFVTAAVPN